MKKLILILLVIAISFGDCEARPGKRKRPRKKHYTKERVSIHRVTTKEKVIFGTLAIGILIWSYRD